MSFSVIFSIIIIIVIFVVAFYVINKFFVTSDCLKMQIFYDDLEENINKVWKAPSANILFNHDVTSDVESICFGDPGKLDDSFSQEKQTYRGYRDSEKNAFVYPRMDCDGGVNVKTLAHVNIPQSFCVSAVKNKINFHITKEDSGESLVTIKP